MNQISYALGLNIGQQLQQMGLQGTLVVEDFAAAVSAILNQKPLQMAPAAAQQVLQQFFTELEAKQKTAAAEAGKAARKAGEEFLAKNAQRPEVTVTPSGLQYEVLTEGTGRKPAASDTVRCHYHGTLIDGTVFDSSYQRGEPCEFGLRQVISGWTEGVQLMQEGAKYRFYIPYNLAYGERGAGQAIPPYSALIFDVELIKIM